MNKKYMNPIAEGMIISRNQTRYALDSVLFPIDPDFRRTSSHIARITKIITSTSIVEFG